MILNSSISYWSINQLRSWGEFEGRNDISYISWIIDQISKLATFFKNYIARLALDGSWRLLTVPDGFWQLLSGPDSTWRVLAAAGVSWGLLNVLSDCWQVLTGPDRYCRLLTALDSSWWLLTAADGSWVLFGTQSNFQIYYKKMDWVTGPNFHLGTARCTAPWAWRQHPRSSRTPSPRTRCAPLPWRSPSRPPPSAAAGAPGAGSEGTDTRTAWQSKQLLLRSK